MGFKQKASSSKKKGPKGKKARAKAKLDRQWGETAIVDDDAQTRRIGNSRLLGKKSSTSVKWGGETTAVIPSNQEKRLSSVSLRKDNDSKKKINQRRRNYNKNVDESSDDSSDDEDSVNEFAAVNNLLTSIRKSKKRKNKLERRKVSKIVEDNDEDESDDNVEQYPAQDQSSSDEEMMEGMEEDGGDDSSMGEVTDDQDEDDDDDDNESIGDSGNGKTVDLFRERFSLEPLKESVMNPNPSTIRKISVDSSIELHVSCLTKDESLADLLLKEKDPKKTFEHWQKSAQTSFEGTRKVLQNQWKRFNKSLTGSQAPIYLALSRYADLFVTADSIKKRNEMHSLYMLHLLNHVLTSRSRIQRHNQQLKELEKAISDDDNTEEDIDSSDKFRDQGFTRPTVLVLLPTRSTCYQFVQDLFKLTGQTMENDQINERFEGEYGNVVDEDDEPTEDQERRRRAVLEKKGKQWNELFADNVNQDDDFKLGISLTPKAVRAKNEKKKGSNVGVKLYTDFYKSDIIVASPLGLKLLITPEEDEKEGDHDYLSSIEICLVQYSDVLMMQNWDHVNDVLALLNQEPQNNNGTDFSRVRNYLLEGQGANWRQLIISSSITDPYLSSSFKRFGKSASGMVKMRRKVDSEDAAIANVLIPIKQVFQKVPVPSFDKQSESRVNYFVKSILPQILRHKQSHTMVYVPSYFDFCSLRNALLKRDVSFVSIHEYSRTSEVSRGRARFLQGRKPIMLYTGRCNFFHRHTMKGVRHMIFLGLPEHPEFYSEHVNAITTATDESDVEAATSVSSCLVLCTRYEALALERIVGSSNCSRMLNSQKSTFMFYS